MRRFGDSWLAPIHRDPPSGKVLSGVRQQRLQKPNALRRRVTSRMRPLTCRDRLIRYGSSWTFDFEEFKGTGKAHPSGSQAVGQAHLPAIDI